jgi:phosphate transport system substrate-binding protein
MVTGSIFPACTCATPKENIRVDGSDTVYVISEAIAEEYQKSNQGGKVSIGMSGTGGGFKKLCSNRINLIGASRVITSSEKTLCQKNNVKYNEFPVAHDGIVVAVNKANTWIKDINVSTLKKIFGPEAENRVTKWSDINPSWPDRKFEIFAPGVSSGTYDYFTQAIVGKQHSSRGDITSSEDHNVVVHGVRTTVDSIGFFSFAYYFENQNDVRALAIIDDHAGKTKAVLPNKETIRTGEYSPLSRSIFVYANRNLSEPEKKFLTYYLEHSQKAALDVGYVPLNQAAHSQAIQLLKEEFHE